LKSFGISKLGSSSRRIGSGYGPPYWFQ